MNTELYLERLGLTESVKGLKGIELLNALQYSHVTKIPYENLDIVNGKPLNLSTEALFQKIVVNHRGGYCFEVNGLFGELLKALGFKVTNLAARFLRGESEIPLRRHRVLLVECEDSAYICDVGIGSAAPRHPLKLEEGVIQQQFGEAYKLERDSFLGWVILEQYKGEWRQFYSFTLEPQIDVDFVTPSFYCEKHPDSIFNKDIMVAIKTDFGRKTLNGREYKVFTGEEVTELRQNLNNSEITEILIREFNISV